MRRCPDLAIEGVDNFNIDEANDAAIVRLVGSQLQEQQEEWQQGMPE